MHAALCCRNPHALWDPSDSETVGVESSVAECLTLFAARQERQLASRTVSLPFLIYAVLLFAHRRVCVQILKWLLARGWLTLRAQMQRSRNNFLHGDLFELMQNWSPALNHVAWAATIPLPRSNVYLRYGLDVSSSPDGHTTFFLGSSTVAAFINTLGRILIDVRRTFEDDPEDFASVLTSVSESLLCLSCIVGHDAVRRVFTETSLARVLEPAGSRGEPACLSLRRPSSCPAF